MASKNSPITAEYVAEDSVQESASPEICRRFAISDLSIRQFLAEFAGTFIFLVFALGVVAQTVLSDGKSGSSVQVGICWGIGLALGVYFSGGVSGGHLNPSITLAFAIFGRLEWKKVPYYMFGQLLGAFSAAVVVYMCYYNSITTFDKTTAGIFATYPAKLVTNGNAFVNEVVATALLVGPIVAICDTMNHGASYGAKPLAIGLVIAAVAMAFGYNTSFAINPARDLGPRILTAMAPWGSSVFTWNNHYFWIPIVAPLVGANVGVGLYTLFVEMHHPSKQPQTNDSQSVV